MKRTQTLSPPKNPSDWTLYGIWWKNENTCERLELNVFILVFIKYDTENELIENAAKGIVEKNDNRWNEEQMNKATIPTTNHV